MTIACLQNGKILFLITGMDCGIIINEREVWRKTKWVYLMHLRKTKIRVK